MVNGEFIACWTRRLQRIPDAAAVLLKGSYARNEPGMRSDVDFDVLVDSGPREDYLAYLVEDATGRLVHISVTVQDMAAWLVAAHEPAQWSFGLSVSETTRLLWARDDALRQRLDQPARMRPPGEPELEDFVEAFGKVSNALLHGDELAARLAAQTLGQLCPSLLRPINPHVFPTHQYDALLAALSLPMAPEGYRDDLLCCLGLSGRTTSLQDIRAASFRLTSGTLALLRHHAHLLQNELPPDLYGYLRDGTLERYIRQDAPS